jgi:membrane protein
MSRSVLSTEQQLESIWSLGGLTLRELAYRVWGGINQTDLINRAYELAYNFLLAVFPMLLFLVALFGALASESGPLRNALLTYIQPVLPPAAYHVLSSTFLEVTHNAIGGKITLGLLFLLFAGSGGMTQLIATLNAAYEVPEGRSWIKVHLLSLGLTLGLSLLIVSAVSLALAGSHFLRSVGQSAGLSESVIIAINILHWMIALSTVILAFATIYYFAPDVKEQHWYWITPGSVAGVALWAIASAGLRAYLHFFNSYTRIYGSLGAVIILLLWFYVTGLAILIGGEINATIEHAAAERGHPEAKPVGKKAA